MQMDVTDFFPRHNQNWTFQSDVKVIKIQQRHIIQNSSLNTEELYKISMN